MNPTELSVGILVEAVGRAQVAEVEVAGADCSFEEEGQG